MWGIKIGPIIAGLGLFGVAVALGAQDLFKNLISGILVLVEKRFKIGDWIIVEGIIEGIVERIGFRSTVIRKFDKSLAIIPNFQFAENAVINVSQKTNWLISWTITLQYDTTIDQLKKIRDKIEHYINNHEDFNTSIGVSVRVDKFADSSIDMYVRCFTKTNRWSEYLKVKRKISTVNKRDCRRTEGFFRFSKSINLCREKMIAIFYLTLQIIKLYSYVVIANVVISWLVAFNVLNTSNRFVYSILEFTYRLTDPFLNKIRSFLPNLGAFDISNYTSIVAMVYRNVYEDLRCTNDFLNTYDIN